MLHILLLILKIIGIIIAVILGILVLLIGIILFVPIRYEADATFDDTLEGINVRAKVMWLLHLVKITVCFKERELSWRIRIAWKNIQSGQADKQAMKEEVGAYEKELDELLDDMEENPEEERSENLRKEPEKELEQFKEGPEEDSKEQEETQGGYEETFEKGLEETEAGVEQKVEESESGSQKRRESIWQKIARICQKIIQKVGNLYQKIRSIFQKTETVCEKIKCTIQNICDKIKTLAEKKDKIMEFISDEVHKRAFLKVKDEGFCLLHKLKPKKFEADIYYGFEDPYLTGKLLAGFSILYPFVGENVSIVPDFEQKVLEGSCHIVGKIRISYFVKMLWNLIWCKEVRVTYRHVRKFEL